MSDTDTAGAARRPFGMALIVLGVLVIVGAAGSFVALREGGAPTDWGMFTANYIFLLSVTQFGVVFCAIMRVCGAHWSRVYYRMGEVITLAFAPLALIGLLLIWFNAQDELFYWVNPEAGAHLSPWLDSTWLLLRHLIAFALFYGCAFFYFAYGMVPDMHQQMVDEASGLKRVFYRWLMSRKPDGDTKSVERGVYFWSPIILVAAFVTQTFVSWDFAMMLVPHWHSTVFPLHFMLGTMFAGTAMMLLFSQVVQKALPGRNDFTVLHAKNIGIMLTAFMCLWLYMFWAHFFVTWFGNLPHEMEPLWRQMYGHYGPFFWTKITALVALPLSFLIFAKVKRNIWLLGFVALVICAGVWINRYLMVLPTMTPDHVPFRSMGDWAGTLFLFGGFLLTMLMLFRALPMITLWDVNRASSDSH